MTCPTICKSLGEVRLKYNIIPRIAGISIVVRAEAAMPAGDSVVVDPQITCLGRFPSSTTHISKSHKHDRAAVGTRPLSVVRGSRLVLHLWAQDTWEGRSVLLIGPHPHSYVQALIVLCRRSVVHPCLHPYAQNPELSAVHVLHDPPFCPGVPLSLVSKDFGELDILLLLLCLSCHVMLTHLVFMHSPLNRPSLLH